MIALCCVRAHHTPKPVGGRLGGWVGGYRWGSGLRGDGEV